MAFNPSKQGDVLNPATQRKNSTNDPGFENNLGYFPYDLSHTEILTPLYGNIVPSMHLITSPGDRHVVRDDTKTILNQIQGNFLNTVNQYTDTFFVSNKTLFPNNWDKLIPNPVKGADIPHSARITVPLLAYIRSLLYSPYITYFEDNDTSPSTSLEDLLLSDAESPMQSIQFDYIMSRIMFSAYITSRGQLLDYLGFQFDLNNTRSYMDSYQYSIDRMFSAIWRFVETSDVALGSRDFDESSGIISDIVSDEEHISTLSHFRDKYMRVFESGKYLTFSVEGGYSDSYTQMIGAIMDFVENFDVIFKYSAPAPAIIDSSDDPFADGSCFNISKVLAYQLCVAEYFTNDTVDNIFTADLYMQLLRGVMYPSVNGYSSEPTFDYNGVPTEYDYISYGGFYSSLLRDSPGINERAYRVGTLLFILRHSIRYGDYFTTGRTRMLAVGQLLVPTDTEKAATVSPVDITIGLVSQRYLNAANRVGNKPMAYYASMFGITPSDDIAKPRYVSHRKVVLQSQITNNTAEDQGRQTTNLVGFSDNMAADVFVDDFGIILSLLSYDFLPIYTTGLDADNRISDRFEYYNPMMQNIGDEPIRLSELDGYPGHYGSTFAYTVRNREYKYKLSKAHGALCYNLPGYLLRMPIDNFSTAPESDFNLRVNPEFIRDRPVMLDSIIYQTTGASPGDYFHFITSVHNEVKSARTIQKAPPVLF